MVRNLLLILAAVALVASTDAAPAAPRGRPSGMVILNSNISAGTVHSMPNRPFITSRRAFAHAQAKPRGQVRAQLMFTVGHINGVQPSLTQRLRPRFRDVSARLTRQGR